MRIIMKIIKVLILIIIAGLGLSSRADGVSESQAADLAIKFFRERLLQYRDLRPADLNIISTTEIKEKTVAVYYVFNFAPEGFIAVSALSQAHPVLFYSFDGNYSPGNHPENFSAWTGQYRRELAAMAEAPGSLPENPLWAHYRELSVGSLSPHRGRDVFPLLHSTWDQGRYYNEMCPADPMGPSGHCVTGCVATTLGQLMNFFRWPDSGTGSYSYNCPPYGTLSADFENSDYRWDEMPSNITHSAPEAAELIHHIGVSVDMVYGPNGSGMYNHKGAYTLKTYFKYSPETQYVFRDTTAMDWDSLLVSHLDRGIPMYYAGWSVPDTNGHAFICDGYQGIGYYHFNWGWSGSYDGYFYTNNLNPGGNNFNLAQELIINAVPDTSLYVYPQTCTGTLEYTALFGTFSDGSGPLYDYRNAADCSWRIAPADSINSLTLRFLEFGLEPGDTLMVYDGDSTNAPLIATLSGYEIPGEITASGTVLFVRFVTDAAATGKGFLAEFFSEIPVYCSGTTILNNPADTVADGSGNWDYHDNSMCMWRIMPPGATNLKLYFSSFQTEPDHDVLKIYDLQTQQLLAEYSGDFSSNPPEPVTSPSGKMLLIFSTNHSETAAGWSAYYESDGVGIVDYTERHVQVWPNPSHGALNISMPSQGSYTLVITDLSGRQVFRTELSGASNTVFPGHLAPGLYLYKLEDLAGSHAGKILIKK